jgi:hypothetical protein
LVDLVVEDGDRSVAVHMPPSAETTELAAQPVGQTLDRQRFDCRLLIIGLRWG